MPAHDDHSFEQFVAATADRFLVTAILLVGGDRGASEDLLQGAYERTYRHGAMTDPRPEACLRRALVNAATSRWRRQRARATEIPPLLADGAWAADPAVTGPDPAERLAQHDLLVRALRALPPWQRTVLALRYVDDLPEADVAAALGCSVGTVRPQASHGLARLRASAHLAALAPPGRGAPDDLTHVPPARAVSPGEPA